MTEDRRHSVNTQPLDLGTELPELAQRITILLDTTDYAVLCTSDKEQSHGALVAFAASTDFKMLYFATSITTLKYTQLKEKSSVSLVLDNRALMGRDLGQIEAVTAKGRAHIIEPDDKISHLRLLKHKHPNLSDFFQAESVAIVSLQVEVYCYVTHFHEVFLWSPP